jgi:hypothetical protein
VPTSYYWKASNNYTVDLSEVTYRVYGPDVVNPPSQGLVKAAEIVMRGLYERFCNITTHILEATDAPSAVVTVHKNSKRPPAGPCLTYGRHLNRVFHLLEKRNRECSTAWRLV